MIIHADGNSSYDADEAIRYGKMLEEIHGYFYEEPCPFEDLWSTKQAADALTIPLAFGEQETSMIRFKWIIENRAADVVQPDILYNGGLIRAAKVALMARQAGMTITPHVSDGFGFVYILHLAAFTPNFGQYMEYKTGFDTANELTGGRLQLQDGKINIPDWIGMGIVADHPFLAEVETVFSI